VSAVAKVSSPDPERQIAQAISELSVRAFSTGLRSVVLTGSLARGEATWFYDDSSARLAGDADVLIVFENRAALPPADHVARLKHQAEAHLRAEGIHAEVGLSAVDPGYLRALQPHIFAYELVKHGKVIWGDTRILCLVPPFSPTDIPLEDGFRLLLNRMIELLDAVCEIDSYGSVTEKVRYRAMKLVLDTCTSYLLFEGQYESTYRERARRLGELATTTSTSQPLPLSSFAARVAEVTRVKLGECDALTEEKSTDLTELIDETHSIWRWELDRLTQSESSASDQELLHKWIVDQAPSARLRGWASIVKRSGTVQSLGHVPHWIVAAAKGSPRRLIYAAASELFFALPALLSSDGEPYHESRWRQLSAKLPVPTNSGSALPDCAWRRLGNSIVFNYRCFLEATRS